MKRSVRISDLEKDLGLEPGTLGYIGSPPTPGEGSIVEWNGRKWTILMISASRGLVLLEN